MRWAVTLMRDRGQRLRRSEWPEPVAGDLEIAFMLQTYARSPLKAAQLYDVQGSVRRPLLLPLFEPVLVTMDSHFMLLQGIELEAQQGEISEHVQVWHCAPASAGG